MTSRKKAGVTFWATVVVVVAVIYPLSWGPAVWLKVCLHQPAWLDHVFDVIYAPVKWVFEGGGGHTPRWLRDVMVEYLVFWIRAARGH